MIIKYKSDRGGGKGTIRVVSDEWAIWQIKWRHNITQVGLTERATPIAALKINSQEDWKALKSEF